MTTKSVRIGRCRWSCRFVFALLVAVATLSAASSAGFAPVPLTPSGAAPLVHRGSTHPDSIEGAVALSGNLANRPVALAAATRGLECARSGNAEAALDQWDMARRIDPGYPMAGLAPVRYTPQTSPRRTLDALLAVPVALVHGFTNQQSMAANLFILVFFPLLIAASVCGLLIALRHSSSLHHLFWEHLQPALPRFAAKWAVWGLFILPLFWSLGILLWVALTLAAAYPLLPKPERRFAIGIVVLMVIAPWGVKLAATVAAPSDPAHVANALWRAQQAGRSPEMLTEIQRLEQRDPDSGLLLFTESLLARQLGDLATGREALRRAQASNDLSQVRYEAAWANLAYKEGHVEEAIRRFAGAAEADPERYDLRYNLSKAYARASLFLKADREMRRAFELNADLVRSEERRRLEEKVDDLIEERLHPAEIWELLLREGDTEAFQLPHPVSILFPGGNPRLLWPGLLGLPLVFLISTRCSRRLVIHTCSQCGRRVCRRCLKRRDRRVFCPECALTVGRWAHVQYTQVLLTRLLGRHDRVRDRILDVSRMFVPGLGAALTGKINRAFLQVFWLTVALTWLVSGGWPLRPAPAPLIEERILPGILLGIVGLIALEIWTVHSELHGLKRKSTLREFLSANRAAPAGRKAA
jgi:hypothetical protein